MAKKKQTRKWRVFMPHPPVAARSDDVNAQGALRFLKDAFGSSKMLERGGGAAQGGARGHFGDCALQVGCLAIWAKRLSALRNRPTPGESRVAHFGPVLRRERPGVIYECRVRSLCAAFAVLS